MKRGAIVCYGLVVCEYWSGMVFGVEIGEFVLGVPDGFLHHYLRTREHKKVN